MVAAVAVVPVEQEEIMVLLIGLKMVLLVEQV